MSGSKQTRNTLRMTNLQEHPDGGGNRKEVPVFSPISSSFDWQAAIPLLPPGCCLGAADDRSFSQETPFRSGQSTAWRRPWWRFLAARSGEERKENAPAVEAGAFMAPRVGLEPTTKWLTATYSAN